MEVLTSIHQLRAPGATKVGAIDSSLATSMGLTDNPGDFTAHTVHSNCSGDILSYGIIFLVTPRWSKKFAMIQVWNGNPTATYFNGV